MDSCNILLFFSELYHILGLIKHFLLRLLTSYRGHAAYLDAVEVKSKNQIECKLIYSIVFSIQWNLSNLTVVWMRNLSD